MQHPCAALPFSRCALSQRSLSRRLLCFELDLNKAPEDRWNGSVQTILRLHEWKYGFGPLFDHYNKSIYSHLNMSMRQMLMKAAMTKTPIYYRELQGMARVFASVGHPEVDIAFLAFNVYYHELAHADDLPHHMHSSNKKRIFRGECTGIVVLPESPALPMLHGRNLDQSVTPSQEHHAAAARCPAQRNDCGAFV